MPEDDFEDIELNDEDIMTTDDEPAAPRGAGLKKYIVPALIVLVQAVAAYGVARFLILPRLALTVTNSFDIIRIVKFLVSTLFSNV